MQVSEWIAIERIDAVTTRGWRIATMRATRWQSSTGAEATTMSYRMRGSSTEQVPAVVTSPAIAYHAGFEGDAYVLDPDLCWHDVDGGCSLVSPLLAVLLAVRVPKCFTSGNRRPVRAIAHFRTRPGRLFIEPRPTGSSGGGGDRTRVAEIWVPGVYPAIVTRWPKPATVTPEAIVAPLVRPNRLAPGNAVFLRDEVDELIPA